jgi:hypothetical protein
MRGFVLVGAMFRAIWQVMTSWSWRGRRVMPLGRARIDPSWTAHAEGIARDYPGRPLNIVN